MRNKDRAEQMTTEHDARRKAFDAQTKRLVEAEKSGVTVYSKAGAEQLRKIARGACGRAVKGGDK